MVVREPQDMMRIWKSDDSEELEILMEQEGIDCIQNIWESSKGRDGVGYEKFIKCEDSILGCQ